MSFSNILYYFDFSKFKLINNLRPRILCFLNINKFPLGLMMMALFIKRLFIIIPHYCQFTPLSKSSYHRKGKLWYKHRNMRCCRRWNFPLSPSVRLSVDRSFGWFVCWLDGWSVLILCKSTEFPCSFMSTCLTCIYNWLITDKRKRESKKEKKTRFRPRKRPRKKEKKRKRSRLK